VPDDILAKLTVLAPPTGAHVVRNVVYGTDSHGDLHLDAYQPSTGHAPWPAVVLVNGDGDEPVITHAKDWGVYRSYGEHLAARHMVGIPFNHRSTRTVGRIEVAGESRAAMTYVREHASELGIDADRIGVWAFSAAGAFALAPLLRERPSHVRAIAGFYTIWDLSFMRDSQRAITDEEIHEWSATAALGTSAEGLPPILVTIADRDSQALVHGADTFAARARELGVNVRIERHPNGQHGFDVRDDDGRSRELILDALEFFAHALVA
jgi:acetyl esterase/lipase